MMDEIMIESLEEANDQRLSGLCLGASPYEDEDLNNSGNWDEWHLENQIDRMREEAFACER